MSTLRRVSCRAPVRSGEGAQGWAGGNVVTSARPPLADSLILPATAPVPRARYLMWHHLHVYGGTPSMAPSELRRANAAEAR